MNYSKDVVKESPWNKTLCSMTKFKLFKNEVKHHNNNGQIHDSGETANVNIVYMFAIRCIFFTKTILTIDSWIIITHFLK